MGTSTSLRYLNQMKLFQKCSFLYTTFTSLISSIATETVVILFSVLEKIYPLDLCKENSGIILLKFFVEINSRKKNYLLCFSYNPHKNYIYQTMLIYRNSYWKCSIKKQFLKMKTHQHRCFPVNIAKSLRTPILKNICEQLLLDLLRKELDFHNSNHDNLLLLGGFNSEMIESSLKDIC